MITEEIIEVLDRKFGIKLSEFEKKFDERLDSTEGKVDRIFTLLGGDKFENGLCEEIRTLKSKTMSYDKIIWTAGGIIIAIQVAMPFIIKVIFK